MEQKDNIIIEETKKKNDEIFKSIKDMSGYILKNIVLIVSICVVITMILFGTYKDALKVVSVMISFSTTVNPTKKKSNIVAAEPNNENNNVKQKENLKGGSNTSDNANSVLGDIIHTNTNDLEGFGDSFTFVAKASFIVCCNVVNIILLNVSTLLKIQDKFPAYGVLMLIILFYLFSKLSSKIINNIVLTFSNKPKDTSDASTFLLNIIFSIFSSITALFLICMIASIITYICYLIYGLFTVHANISTNILRFVYGSLFLIIPFGAWLSGFDLKTITNSMDNSSEISAKGGSTVNCTSYNWALGMALIFIIPISSAIMSIGSLVSNSVSGLYTYMKDLDNSKEISGETLKTKKILFYIRTWALLIIIFLIILFPIIFKIYIPTILDLLKVSKETLDLYKSIVSQIII